LEFHPLYCKEDLVLLNTSCLLFSHRLVTASWGHWWEGGKGCRGRPEGARDREGRGRAFLSAFLSPTPLLVTTFHLSLAGLWPSPSETASTQTKEALNRERRRERKKENGERKEHKLFYKRSEIEKLFYTSISSPCMILWC
jgi:hypothetical protein